MPLWICWNCTDEMGRPGKKFEADAPVCPCGVDGNKPEMTGYIAKCEVIHFDPPHPVLKGRGMRRRVCDDKPIHEAGGLASGHPAAVNCGACKRTPEYVLACEKFGEPVPHKEADFVVA